MARHNENDIPLNLWLHNELHTFPPSERAQAFFESLPIPSRQFREELETLLLERPYDYEALEQFFEKRVFAPIRQAFGVTILYHPYTAPRGPNALKGLPVPFSRNRIGIAVAYYRNCRHCAEHPPEHNPELPALRDRDDLLACPDCERIPWAEVVFNLLHESLGHAWDLLSFRDHADEDVQAIYTALASQYKINKESRIDDPSFAPPSNEGDISPELTEHRADSIVAEAVLADEEISSEIQNNSLRDIVRRSVLPPHLLGQRIAEHLGDNGIAALALRFLYRRELKALAQLGHFHANRVLKRQEPSPSSHERPLARLAVLRHAINGIAEGIDHWSSSLTQAADRRSESVATIGVGSVEYRLIFVPTFSELGQLEGGLLFVYEQGTSRIGGAILPHQEVS